MADKEQVSDQSVTKRKPGRKRIQTVRERSQLSAAPAKSRRLRSTARTIARPVRMIGAFIAAVARPFAFLLKPFKTRPMRFIGRIVATILLLRYFQQSWQELRKTQWPNARDTTKLTLAVFTFAIIFGLIIAITDYGLDKVFRKVLLS